MNKSIQLLKEMRDRFVVEKHMHITMVHCSQFPSAELLKEIDNLLAEEAKDGESELHHTSGLSELSSVMAVA